MVDFKVFFGLFSPKLSHYMTTLCQFLTCTVSFGPLILFLLLFVSICFFYVSVYLSVNLCGTLYILRPSLAMSHTLPITRQITLIQLTRDYLQPRACYRNGSDWSNTSELLVPGKSSDNYGAACDSLNWWKWPKFKQNKTVQWNLFTPSCLKNFNSVSWTTHGQLEKWGVDFRWSIWLITVKKMIKIH